MGAPSHYHEMDTGVCSDWPEGRRGAFSGRPAAITRLEKCLHLQIYNLAVLVISCDSALSLFPVLQILLYFLLQRGMMRVLSVVPKSPPCLHQHVRLHGSLCWVHRVVRLLPRWI